METSLIAVLCCIYVVTQAVLVEHFLGDMGAPGTFKCFLLYVVLDPILTVALVICFVMAIIKLSRV